MRIHNKVKRNKINLEIKLLTEQDYAQWYPLWQGYLDFYQVQLADEISQATWRKVATSQNVKGFGAWQGERLVGFTHIVIHPNTWNTTDCCYLEDLFVLPEHRGQGVGKKLIEAVYQFAEKQQFNRVYWVTDADNFIAQKLYKQLADKMGVVQYRKNF